MPSTFYPVRDNYEHADAELSGGQPPSRTDSEPDRSGFVGTSKPILAILYEIGKNAGRTRFLSSAKRV